MKLHRFLLLGGLLLWLLPLRMYAQQGSYAAMETEVLKLVNEHRRAEGLPALVMNSVITAQALEHSRNMATGKVDFGHDGFDARTTSIGKQITPANAFAENVAYGATTAREAVDMWIESAGHKKNMEGRYNLTGIGIARSKSGELYFTQIFLRKD